MGTLAKRFDNLNSDFVTEVQSSLWSNYLDYLSRPFFTTLGEFPIDVRGAEVK
jgi:hypothetical protein